MIDTDFRIRITIDTDSTVTVDAAGQRHRAECRDEAAAWRVATRESQRLAQQVERPLVVDMESPSTHGAYLITPEGELSPLESFGGEQADLEPVNEQISTDEAVVPASAPEAQERELPAAPAFRARLPRSRSSYEPLANSIQDEAPQPFRPRAPRLRSPHSDVPAAPQEAKTPRKQRRREVPTPEGRPSFLADSRPMAQPAKNGLRGALNLMGAHLAPGANERAEREDEEEASTYWPGPRTIAIVNGKGGVGKTPTTALLSAVFARYGGAVLAWDANPYRGTLGWRTEQAQHDATILDLMPEVSRLLSPEARAADLARYTHHQRADRYDVLRSQPRRLAGDQRITGDDIARIHQIIGRFYRLILMDSGNDESADMWRAMVDHSDQLVVVTSTQADHAEAGSLLLDALDSRGGHDAQLSARAVAIVTQADPKATKRDLDAIREGYAQLLDPSRVVTIPHDPAMVSGPLRYDSLRPNTQRAWLRAAAVIARSLSDDTTQREGTTRW